MRQRRFLLVWVLAKDALVNIEHFAIAAVADGVHAKLVAVGNGEFGRALDLLGRLGLQAHAVGLIGVRLQQPCAARAQRSVDIFLDGANGQVIVSSADRAIAVKMRFERLVGVSQHHPQAQPKLAVGGHGAENVRHGQRRTRIFERGDPLGEALAGGDLDGLVHIAMAGMPALVGGHHEARGAFAQQPGRVAAGVLQNLAAGRIGCVAGDAGHRHGLRIDEGGMAAGVRQQHRIMRRNAVERGVQGKAFHVGVGRMVPFALMPAAAHDPIARLGLAGGAGYLGDDFVPRARFAKIEAHAIFAERSEVAVPFDEPRNGEHPVKVDHPGLRTDPASRIAIRAHRRNPPAAHRHHLSERQSGIHSGDFAISQHQIGRLSERRHRRQKHQKERPHGHQDTSCPPAGGADHRCLWSALRGCLRGAGVFACKAASY